MVGQVLSLTLMVPAFRAAMNRLARPYSYSRPTSWRLRTARSWYPMISQGESIGSGTWAAESPHLPTARRTSPVAEIAPVSVERGEARRVHDSCGARCVSMVRMKGIARSALNDPWTIRRAPREGAGCAQSPASCEHRTRAAHLARPERREPGSPRRHEHQAGLGTAFPTSRENRARRRSPVDQRYGATSVATSAYPASTLAVPSTRVRS